MMSHFLELLRGDVAARKSATGDVDRIAGFVMAMLSVRHGLEPEVDDGCPEKQPDCAAEDHPPTHAVVRMPHAFFLLTKRTEVRQ